MESLVMNVKLLIKGKYPHTIFTERYRFCCFKQFIEINGTKFLEFQVSEVS